MKSSFPYLISSVLFACGGIACAQPATTQAASKKPQIEPAVLAEQWQARYAGMEQVGLAPWTPPGVAIEKSQAPQWAPPSVAVEKNGTSQWTPAQLATAATPLPTPWHDQLSVASSPSGPAVTAVGDGLSVNLPSHTQVPSVSWALTLVQKDQWDVLACELAEMPFDFKSLTAPVAPDHKVELRTDLIFGGEIDPTASADAVKKRIDHILSLGFNCPIVPIRKLSGDWRKTYDAFFKSIDGRVVPIAALCLKDLNLKELLELSEFVQRYECNLHSVILNYDLTNAQVNGVTDSAAFRQATSNVALAMALIHRRSPAAFLWLGAGYYRDPDWRTWLKAFDAAQYSGILLSGESAIAACLHPQAAAQVRKMFVEQAGRASLPVGIVDFHIPMLDALVIKNDDQGIEQYELMRASLKNAGMPLVHITTTPK